MLLAFVVVSLLGALAAAQLQIMKDCQCPKVKCSSTDAVDLCNCLNSRETLCHKVCPSHVPTYLPCPARPPVTTPAPTAPSTSATPRPTCKCEEVFCAQIWPGSCYCANNVKMDCYQKCGGAKPVLQSCPPTTVVSLPSSTTPPASTTIMSPLPSQPTNPICGGGRANNLTCDEGYTCIQKVSKPGCGPTCDGLGICVEDKLCGGFTGAKCTVSGKVCIDDPRDECDPTAGGADCSGLCAWPAVIQI